jgi:uncharacterized protein YjgD (DUF1641 family)
LAKPIPLQLPPRDRRAELTSRLERAQVEHAEAILAAIDLAQKLHDCGALELLSGLASSHDKIVEDATTLARKPESIRKIRSLLILMKAVEPIEPELLESLAMAIPAALACANPRAADPPGLWTLIKQFRKRDMRRALSALNSLLESWGMIMDSKDALVKSKE